MSISSQVTNHQLKMDGAFASTGRFICSQGTLTEREVDLSMKNFRMYDVDGDGAISETDFRTAMINNDPSWGTQEKEVHLSAMFRAVDRSGTGFVSFADFCVMRVRKKIKTVSKSLGDDDCKDESEQETAGVRHVNCVSVSDVLDSAETHPCRSQKEIDASEKENVCLWGHKPRSGVHSAHGRLGLRKESSFKIRRKIPREYKVLVNAAATQSSDMVPLIPDAETFLERNAIYRF